MAAANPPPCHKHEERKGEDERDILQAFLGVTCNDFHSHLEAEVFFLACLASLKADKLIFKY